MQVTEATKTCSAIIKIFMKHDSVVDMINALIINEVKNQCAQPITTASCYMSIDIVIAYAASAGTLFRNNSIATHMMTCYTKAIGIPYLKNTVAPEVLYVFEKIESEGVSYEIDPEKVPPYSTVEQGIANVKNLVHRFFDRILNSRSFMPKYVVPFK